MTPIFVISLTQSPRRERMRQQLQALSLDFVFFDAVRGSEGHVLFAKYDDRKRRRHHGRSLSAGELGCFASHYLLWQHCCDLQQTIVVLEDSIQLNANFAAVLAQMDAISAHGGFVKLHNFTPAPTKAVLHLDTEVTLVKYLARTNGTKGYILTPAAAGALIQNAQTWFEPVDDFMDKEWQHHIAKFGIVPMPVGNQDMPSEIGARPKAKLPWYLKVRREWLNIPSAWQKWRFLARLRRS